MTIIAGKSAHRRKAKPRDWTRAKEAKFLGALAETCNVTLSAELAGVSGTTVYRHRAKDAAFRDGWGTGSAGWTWRGGRCGRRWWRWRGTV